MHREAWNRRDAILHLRLTGDLYERSAFHRGRLERSGLGRHGIVVASDLYRLPPMLLEDVATISTLSLVETSSAGRRRFRGNTRPGSRGKYWPLRWTLAEGVPLAYSSRDLETLAKLGELTLRSMGVGRDDMIVSLLPPSPSRDHLQMISGAQRGRMSMLDLGPGKPARDLSVVSPTVLIGNGKELVRALDSTTDDEDLSRVHTVVVVGAELSGRQRERIVARLGTNMAIMRAWAPEGVLALWYQCRGSDAFHTYPEQELIEVVDPVSGRPVPKGLPGVVVWTGVGWYATALLRLRTRTAVQTSAGDLCPRCARRCLRIEEAKSKPGFPTLLDASPVVGSWYAELQRVSGREMMAIWLSPRPGASSIEVLSAVTTSIGDAEVHVVEASDVERRVADARGERFSDRRGPTLDGEG